MLKHTIVNVQDVRPENGPQPVWFVELALDGEELHHGVHFPHELLHWRVAEYGIDPEEFGTLMDIALHERFMGLQYTDPTFLYNTDEKTAREAHLARVARIKTRVSHEDPDNLLDTIQKAYDPNNPVLEKYRTTVREARSRNLERKANG